MKIIIIIMMLMMIIYLIKNQTFSYIVIENGGDWVYAFFLSAFLYFWFSLIRLNSTVM